MLLLNGIYRHCSTLIRVNTVVTRWHHLLTNKHALGTGDCTLKQRTTHHKPPTYSQRGQFSSVSKPIRYNLLEAVFQTDRFRSYSILKKLE